MMEMDDRTREVSSVYFDWLVSLVGEEWYGHTYRFLLRRLFDREYYWTIDMDENRAEDGRALREEFWDIFPEFYHDETFLGPAVVLEVLIGLGRRVEFEVPSTLFEVIFWRMIENLGLLGYHDEVFCEAYSAFTDEILGKWMSNSTDWHSPFRMDFPDFEPSETELWYQMHHFLVKNPNFG